MERLESVTKSIALSVIAKDAEQNLVYGWASIAMASDGRPVIDLQGDVIDIYDLEKAAAEFVKHWRQGGDMHQGGAPNDLVSSVVFTPELMDVLKIQRGSIPYGWLVGFEVTPEEFAKVKKGSRLMFSIEGEAERVDLEAA